MRCSAIAPNGANYSVQLFEQVSDENWRLAGWLETDSLDKAKNLGKAWDAS